MAATALKLRSPNFKSVGITAPTGGLTAGQMHAANSLIGVIVESKDAAADAVLIYECEKVIVPKVAGTGITFSIGSKVYYNSSAKKVTNVSTGNTLCGRALEAADASDGEVLIHLTGNVVA